MAPDDLPSRIVDQFSYRGENAAIWRAFDRAFATDRFLNLGYSRPYQTHLIGSPQRRLALVLGRGLADRLPATTGRRLLDLGCGRGGPAIALSRRFGFDVVGLDLVPYNVERARANAAQSDARAAFVVGEAGQLPFEAGSFAGCVAVDSAVYFPAAHRVFDGLADVVRTGGVVAVSDLVCDPLAVASARAAVDAFADGWDMSRIPTRPEYLDRFEAAGFSIEAVTDVTANSIGRFRKWTRLYLGLADRTDLLDRVFARWDLDGAAITDRVRLAHAALPALEHVLVFARR